MQQREVTLAGRPFSVAEPTFDALVRLADLYAQIGATSSGANLNTMLQIVMIGLEPEHPELTAEAVRRLPIKPAELVDATHAIGVLAGLIPEPPEGSTAPAS